MQRSHAHRIGALIVGALLALPLASSAQTAPAPAKPPETVPAPATAPAAAPAPAPAAAAPTPAPGSTAVPGWNVPPDWSKVDTRPAYASVPGRETNVLIQGSGHEWRKFRNGPLTQYGGWLLVIALAVVVLLYLIKGRIKIHGKLTGRLIERFTALERASHWTVAISFVLLGLSGTIILFGKYIILPWLGHAGFSWITIFAKNLHNFVGPLFIFSLVVMVLLYLKDNLPKAGDLAWLMRLGGMLSGKEMPSGRFNAGEKAWFWVGSVFLGIAVSVTGLILDFPNWNAGRELMQGANVVHAIAAIFFMSAAFGHIYMGISMEGAYTAMSEGYVDETWAIQHHSTWYEEVKAGKRPEKVITATAQPATGD
jgi:formate dehydrogenase subunit gamma